jgi:CDGSH-type Zn-finger protein
MDAPKIAGLKPQKVELEGGKTYYFCSCGLSENQPFCDGAHKGTGFKSIHYTPENDETKWACCCKCSKTMPFCDGSHKEL